jgi:hypothetical protein
MLFVEHMNMSVMDEFKYELQLNNIVVEWMKNNFEW